MVGKGGGGGRWAKQAPLTRVGLDVSGRARGGASREVAPPGSAPLSVPEDPPRFPDLPVWRTGNMAEKPISAHPPFRRGWEEEGSGRGRLGRPRTAMGAPIAVPSGGGGGGGGVSNPASKPGSIGKKADAVLIGHGGDTSRARRVNLSEGKPPKSAPHWRRGRWGAAANPAPPIFESGEATMGPPKEGGTKGDSAEETPFRLLKRSEARKSHNRGKWSRGGEGRFWKFRSLDPNFQAAHRRKRR